MDNFNESMNLEESVISFEALYESMYKCRKGVMWKGSVASYFLNGIERTLELEDQLNRGTYMSSPPFSFKVKYPKERDILSVTFRDRVYQRSLNDNQIYPSMVQYHPLFEIEQMKQYHQ